MELYKKLNISDFLYDDIKKRLKRTPNDFETYLFSAMHSEHCGYMHSKNYIKDFYKEDNLTTENAGCIKIKDYLLFFKMESHNHPCAIAPYQGAMTGIGGIVRDILALNCKPIALLNSIKFEKKGYHFQQVVKGISDYGNSIGVPTIGGETIFDNKFKNLPIVNVFASGIVHKDKIKLSAAKNDCLVVLLGSPSGIDGLNGANFASNPLEEKRSSVQIGDPYTKKKLIDATLKINNLKDTIACQDLGAAGILSSTSEMAYKGNVGIELYLENVHTQIKNIQPYEIMLSESQERMMFVVRKDAISKIDKIAKEFELKYSVIGKTTKDKKYKVFYKNKKLADIELEILCNPYCYTLKKSFTKENKKENKKTNKETFEELLNNLNFSRKNEVFEQFDDGVKGITSFSFNQDSIGIQYLKETNNFIGYSIHTALNSNPIENTRNTFLNCYRKLIARGFVPKGLTNCLNFSNPNYDNVQNDFLETIETLKDLSFKYKIPVVSGNVSFYNETNDNILFPTTTLAMVGVAEKKDIIEFKINKNDKIYLLDDYKKIKENYYRALSIGRLGLVGTLLKHLIIHNYGFEIMTDDYFTPYLNKFIVFSSKKLNLDLIGSVVSDKIIFDNLKYDIKEIKKYYE